jgi:catechol 2,3-dioxygenase-like lactoylglutathione lyase family enzyme
MLAERIYADPGMRTVPTDLDFLVRADDLNRAVSFFSDLGFEVHDDTIWADGLPHYHYGLNPPGSHLPKVELHWRVHWYEAEYAERVLDRSTLDAEGVRRAVPVDDLAMLLIIFARDGFMGLRLAADIAAWWDAQGHLLAPGELGAVMRESPRLSQALLAALTVAERTVGLPSGELGIAEQRLDRRAGRAVRLANWRMLGSPEQLATNITLVDLLLTPRGARRVFWRHYYAQPLGEYVRTYGWPPAARVRNHLRRAVHVAARGLRSSVLYLARLWSIRGGRRYDAFP